MMDFFFCLGAVCVCVGEGGGGEGDGACEAAFDLLDSDSEKLEMIVAKWQSDKQFAMHLFDENGIRQCWRSPWNAAKKTAQQVSILFYYDPTNPKTSVFIDPRLCTGARGMRETRAASTFQLLISVQPG